MTAPTGSGNSVVTQTSYASQDTQVWKFIEQSDGTYKISPKSNTNLYMAAGDIFSTADQDLEIRTAQSDGGDRWCIFDFNDISCVGIQDPEHENCDHTSTFPGIYSNMQSRGFSTYHTYEYATADQLAAMMNTSKVVVTNSHGSPTQIYLNDSNFTVSYVNSLPENIFSDVKLILYVACETGKDGEGANNLVNATANRGAQIVIGFENIIDCKESDLWVAAFFENIGSGLTVQNAIAQADLMVYKAFEVGLFDTISTNEHYYRSNIDVTINN